MSNTLHSHSTVLSLLSGGRKSGEIDENEENEEESQHTKQQHHHMKKQQRKSEHRQSRENPEKKSSEMTTKRSLSSSDRKSRDEKSSSKEKERKGTAIKVASKQVQDFFSNTFSFSRDEQESEINVEGVENGKMVPPFSEISFGEGSNEDFQPAALAHPGSPFEANPPPQQHFHQHSSLPQHSHEQVEREQPPESSVSVLVSKEGKKEKKRSFSFSQEDYDSGETSGAIFSSRRSGEASSHESKQINDPRIKTYKRRWYMLFLYCMANLLTEALPFAFAAVQDKAAIYYGVSDSQISNLVVLNFGICLVLLLFVSFFSDTLGLGKVQNTGMFLLLIGSWLRYFSSSSDRFWLVVVSQIVIALAFPFLVDSTITLFANNWFPDDERATASSATFVFVVFGNAAAEFIGPLIVVGDGTGGHGHVMDALIAESGSFSSSGSVEISSNLHQLLSQQFHFFNLLQSIAVTIIALLTFFSFKGEPDIPSNYSLLLKRKNGVQKKPWDFIKEIGRCLKSGPFYPLIVGYGIVYGGSEALIAVMNPMLVPEGYTTAQAGLCAIGLSSVGFLGSFISGFVADKTKSYKTVLRVLAILYILTGVLTYTQLKPDNFAMLFIAFSLHGFIICSIFPVSIDTMVEVTYPISEPISAGLAGVVGCGLTSLLTKAFSSLADPTTKKMKNALLCYLIFAAISTVGYMVMFGEYVRLETETEESTHTAVSEAEDDGDDDEDNSRKKRQFPVKSEELQTFYDELGNFKSSSPKPLS